MANTTTSNYSFVKPEVGADTDAWGTHLNADLDSLDSTIFTVSGVASAALPKAGGTMTGALAHVVGALSTPGITWAGDLNTGAYWIGADHWALVAGGVSAVDITATTVTVPLALVVTGATTHNGAVTVNALLTTTASASGGSGLNVPHGAAPTSPVNGDVWTTTTGVFARVNGSTVTLATTGGTGLSSANNLSDVASASTSRTNLGVTATGADTAYAFRANNLSDLASAASARTNLGLGALAVLATPTFAAAGAFNAGQDYATPLTTPTTTEVGYMGLPQVSTSGNRTTVLTDRGKCIHFTATATCTIDSNANVAAVIGTVMEFSVVSGATLTIQITSDTLRKVPDNTTGTLTLTGPGSVFVEKKTSTEWWARGDA